jgi:hypothetical protein
MVSARSRLLAVTVIATSFVASISWALVLCRTGASHPASLRVMHGVSVVLHHHDEQANALGHVHHHGMSHEHPQGGRHADDHVIAVSGEPASLRGQHDFAVAVAEWIGGGGPVVWMPTPPSPISLVRIQRWTLSTLPLHRPTTVLLI